MTILTDASLDFARAHIEAYYDSDFFPKRDEFVALWACWDDVKKHLGSMHVEKLHLEPPRTMPASKASGGYRIVHQLEPLNSMVYTALAHSVATTVEQSRVPKNIAYSYRIELSNRGFFERGNGYRDFVGRCRTLAKGHAYVLVADIADFYNRLYLHRLGNAIDHAGCQPSGTAKTVEQFLTNLNGKASQGIPVGPAASIIMAEAVLTDVDQLIATKGFAYARYVDDIRVFSKSKAPLEALLEELVQHLFDAHRLQLSAAKTRIIGVKDFRPTVQTPEDYERSSLLDLAKAVCDYGDQYTPDDIDDLVGKYLQPTAEIKASKATGRFSGMLRSWQEQRSREKEQIRGQLLGQLLADGVSRKPIDLGLVRQALRQARRCRDISIYGEVLRHVEALEPALPDAVLYLHAVAQDRVIVSHINELRSLVSSSTFRRSRFARHWIYWFLSSQAGLVKDSVIGPVLWTDAPVEWQMRAARATRNLAKVRQQKSAIGGLGMWDRRAVLLASEVMPRDERKAWLASVSPRDIVETSIVSWANSQP